MPRYKIVLGYDGSAYAGWQIQPGHPTVQATLQEAIRTVTSETVITHGSGRTDQGVHARHQVVHLDLERPENMAPVLLKGLNGVLPPDIRVYQVWRVRGDFDARRSAIRKEYRYFIWNAPVVPPFLRLYRTQIRNPLNATAMTRAAEHLVGKHDFAAFTANPNRVVETTVRTLSRLTVRRRGDEIVISATADGFLYKMVRSLAGFLIRVGEGAVPPEAAKTILHSKERTARVPTAPPQGLFLWQVTYPRCGAMLRAKDERTDIT